MLYNAGTDRTVFHIFVYRWLLPVFKIESPGPALGVGVRYRYSITRVFINRSGCYSIIQIITLDASDSDRIMQYIVYVNINIIDRGRIE